MNKVIYTGRLTKDAEVKELANEKKTKTVYFTIAVPDSYVKTKADFVNCQAFGPTVNYLTKYGKKGAYIELEGKTSTFTTKEGHSTSIAVADKVNIIFANSKKEEESPKDNSNQSTPSIDVGEDDLPF